jgi:heme/copper-type cytochrome/quinol oxidase subunit 2
MGRSRRGVGEFLVVLGSALLIAVVGFAGYAAHNPTTQAQAAEGTQPAAAVTSTYTPQVRSFTMTIVPYWVHEETGVFDYLNADFSKRGILHDKEVWGFNPSSITVYQGDTVDIALYNPSSDPHTWTITDLGVSVPVGATAKTDVRFTANKVGLFQFNCEVGEHFPFMNGQLTVLPATVAPQG